MSDVITVIVENTSKKGIYVNVGDKNLSILIKTNQLAKESENARPSRFVRGDKIDAMITEVDNNKKTVALYKSFRGETNKRGCKKIWINGFRCVIGRYTRPSS